jgi:GntR family transcriptional regulator/MocR family aminotransferase
VVQAALEKGIELRALSGFYNAGPADAQAKASGLLLGFAAVSPEEIKRGVLALRPLLKD